MVHVGSSADVFYFCNFQNCCFFFSPQTEKIREEPVCFSSPTSPLLSVSHHVCLFCLFFYPLCVLILALFVLDSSLSLYILLP